LVTIEASCKFHVIYNSLCLQVKIYMARIEDVFLEIENVNILNGTLFIHYI